MATTTTNTIDAPTTDAPTTVATETATTTMMATETATTGALAIAAMTTNTSMVVDSDEPRKRTRSNDDNIDNEQHRTEPQQQLSQPITCVTCSSNHIKYRCPRCERITCSLACCLDHKKTFDCDGKRDRTKYVPIKQFTDADLSSDFFFLEEVARSASSAARSRTALSTTAATDSRSTRHKKRKVSKGKAAKRMSQSTTQAMINPHVSSTDWLARFPVPWQQLVQHAAKRGVALTLLAPGMSKRERNTSHVAVRSDALAWRVEWTFPHADVAVTLAEPRASDTQTLFELLAQYLDKRPENAGIRGKLRKYAVADWRTRVLLLLRREFTPASTPQYYRLNGDVPLARNLQRKAVVEFPVVIVALQTDAAQYPVAHDRIEIIDDDNSDSSDDEAHSEANGDDGDDNAASRDQPSAGDGDDETMDEPSTDNDVRPNEPSSSSADASAMDTLVDTDMDAVDTEDSETRSALLQAFLDDESSVDDLLPSIAEADDELLMFGEDVDGVDFLGKPLSSLSWTAAPISDELTEQPRAS